MYYTHTNVAGVDHFPYKMTVQVGVGRLSECRTSSPCAADQRLALPSPSPRPGAPANSYAPAPPSARFGSSERASAAQLS